MPSSVYCASIFCWSLTSSAHILTVVLQVQGFLLTDNRGIPQSSEFSMLNLWKHPKTQSIRLYLAPKLIKPALAAIGESWDPKSVKAWLEEVDSYWSIKVTVRAEEPAPTEAIDALKSVLLEAAGLVASPGQGFCRPCRPRTLPRPDGGTAQRTHCHPCPPAVCHGKGSRGGWWPGCAVAVGVWRAQSCSMHQ